MSITVAPRQARYTKPKGISLKVLEDFVPYVGAERPQSRDERWLATSGTRDRDWTGKGVGCYHGTDHNGRAILCEGQRCKFLPRKSADRPNRGNRPKRASASRTSAARPTREAADAYIRSCGYSGLITPHMRSLAYDVLAHQAQVAEYCNSK